MLRYHFVACIPLGSGDSVPEDVLGSVNSGSLCMDNTERTGSTVTMTELLSLFYSELGAFTECMFSFCGYNSTPMEHAEVISQTIYGGLLATGT